VCKYFCAGRAVCTNLECNKSLLFFAEEINCAYYVGFAKLGWFRRFF
jgi:succinate dehydrogenase/fumarate reductase flavoprotein subunit